MSNELLCITFILTVVSTLSFILQQKVQCTDLVNHERESTRIIIKALEAKVKEQIQKESAIRNDSIEFSSSKSASKIDSIKADPESQLEIEVHLHQTYQAALEEVSGKMEKKMDEMQDKFEMDMAGLSDKHTDRINNERQKWNDAIQSVEKKKDSAIAKVNAKLDTAMYEVEVKLDTTSSTSNDALQAEKADKARLRKELGAAKKRLSCEQANATKQLKREHELKKHHEQLKADYNDLHKQLVLAEEKCWMTKYERAKQQKEELLASSKKQRQNRQHGGGAK